MMSAAKISFVLLILFTLGSCAKDDLDKKDYQKDKKEEIVKDCKWDASEVSDPAIWAEYVVEPIVTSEECGNCIIGGVVKYHKIDTEFAYVIYYGKGECDNEAYLATYYDYKKDKGKKVDKCLVTLECEIGG